TSSSPRSARDPRYPRLLPGGERRARVRRPDPPAVAVLLGARGLDARGGGGARRRGRDLLLLGTPPPVPRPGEASALDPVHGRWRRASARAGAARAGAHHARGRDLRTVDGGVQRGLLPLGDAAEGGVHGQPRAAG